MSYFDGPDDQQLTPDAEAEARRKVLGMIAGAGKPSILGRLPEPSPVMTAQPGTRDYDLRMSSTNPPNVPKPRFADPMAPDVSNSGAPALGGLSPISSPRPVRPNVMPMREDFPEGKPLPTWKKVLGLSLAALSGPQNAGPLATRILNKPKLEADEQFNRATQDWERGISDEAKQAQTANIRSEIKARENPKPEKTENAQQNYADAVADAIKRGVDPSQDKTVQQWADAITSLQKQPSAPADKTAKPGTVNGKPAWGIQTEQGWVDPETRQIIHGFTPQPSFAETGLWEPTMMPDPSGKGGMVPGKFNKRTGEVVPIAAGKGGVSIPKPAQKEIDDALTTARGMDRLERAQTQLLQGAAKRGTSGPLGGGPYLNGPESMQFVANHIAVTFGSVKGARIGRDIIEQHVKARDLDQATEAMAQRVLSGGIITYQQAQQMLETAKINRKQAWQQARDAATQYGVPDAVKMPPEFSAPSGGAVGGFKPF